MKFLICVLILNCLFLQSMSQDWEKRKSLEDNKMELTVSKDSLTKILLEYVKLPEMMKTSYLTSRAIFILKGDAKGKIASIQRLEEKTPQFDSLTARVLSISKKYWDEISLEKKLKGKSSYLFYVSFTTYYDAKKEKLYFKLLTNNVSVKYDSTDTYPALFIDTVRNNIYVNKIKVSLKFSQQNDGSYGTVGLGLSFDSTGNIVNKSIIKSASEKLNGIALASLDRITGYFIAPHSNGKKTAAYSEMYIQLDDAGYSVRDWKRAKNEFGLKNYKTANKYFKRTASYYFDNIEAQFNAGVSSIYVKDTTAACKYFYKAYELTKIKPYPYNTPLAKIITTINTYCIE